ncbi:hypothetical protein [Anabaena sp. CCY 0017]
MQLKPFGDRESDLFATTLVRTFTLTPSSGMRSLTSTSSSKVRSPI